MTCIVGMLDKKTDKVIIGGDSAGSSATKILFLVVQHHLE